MLRSSQPGASGNLKFTNLGSEKATLRKLNDNCFQLCNTLAQPRYLI